MATRNVRFEFHCERTLTFHHDLPGRLIGANNAADPGYRQAYAQAMVPVMREHMNECIAASHAKCSVCETAPTKQVLTTPMSYLHMSEDPFVGVIVTPVCEKARCNTQGEANVNAVLAEVTGMGQGEVARGSGGIPRRLRRGSRGTLTALVARAINIRSAAALLPVMRE
ncbi:hypothetical protein SCUP234_11609 [Seiridium cupressi]